MSSPSLALPAPRPTHGSDTRARTAAFRLADRLAGDAVPDARGAPCWSGDEVDPDASAATGATVLRHGAVDDGLLTGRAGIALALTSAATARGGDPGLVRVARDTITAVMSRRTEPAPGELGWQSGDLGIAHAADGIAAALDDGPLALSAAALAARAVTALAGGGPQWLPTYPDLLDGLAGHLLAVLSARLPASLDRTRRDAAARLVAAIHAAAVRDEHGARWHMAGTDLSVAGMAHGAAGIALALTAAEAAGIRGSDRALVEDAAMWEAGCYDPGANGWWDLRIDEPVTGMAWCHGAPGVGVAAAARWQLGDDEVVGTYLRAARSVRAHEAPDDGDGTLCHGRAGIVELHLAGAEAWPSSGEHLRAARGVAQVLAAGVRPDGTTRWTHGVAGGGSPAVLDGVAGVVATLLRCDDPRRLATLAHPGMPR